MTDEIILVGIDDLIVVSETVTQTVIIEPNGETVIIEPNAPGPSGPQGLQGDNSIADIAFAFQGNLLDGEELIGYALAHGMTLSQADSVAKCKTAPTGDVVMQITKTTGLVTSSMGTVTFPAGQKTGTVVLTITVLAAGDVVAFVAPDPADVGLASVTVTLAGETS